MENMAHPSLWGIVPSQPPSRLYFILVDFLQNSENRSLLFDTWHQLTSLTIALATRTWNLPFRERAGYWVLVAVLLFHC